MQTRFARDVLLAIVMIGLVPRGAPAALRAPSLTASAALLMDAASGKVLWARNPDIELPMASTTKVMTAILALENAGTLRKSATVTARACTVGGSKIDLRPGQRVAVEDLVYAILLNSANDASMVLAETLGGSVDVFAEHMTARARELGATHTRFADPSGLSAAGHYTTVRDLAVIFRHALGLARFRDILGVRSAELQIENTRQRLGLRSHNRLLGAEPYAAIGKTGSTGTARKCFVGASRHGDRELIVTVLGSDDLWGDTQRLLAFGFDGGFPDEPVIEVTKIVRGRGAGQRPAAVARLRGYTIRVGTFAQREAAERLQRTLTRRGYNVVIDRRAGRPGRLSSIDYSVEVGPYPEQRRAEAVARAVQTQIAVATNVVRH